MTRPGGTHARPSAEGLYSVSIIGGPDHSRGRSVELEEDAPLEHFEKLILADSDYKRDRPRRVIAKVEHHLGELFPRVGFIITTLTGTNRAVVHFYNHRGTAEQWIKEGKAATHWTRLSCHGFRANEVRPLLGVIAYNLGHLLRRLALPLTSRIGR